MHSITGTAILLCVLSTCGQAINKAEDTVFRVEIVTSAPKKPGRAIELSLRGFVDKDGWKISNRRLKEVYCTARKTKHDKNECVLHIYFHQSDKEEMTLQYLFKHIETIREIRDKKSNMYVYIIAN